MQLTTNALHTNRDEVQKSSQRENLTGTFLQRIDEVSERVFCMDYNGNNCYDVSFGNIPNSHIYPI